MSAAPAAAFHVGEQALPGYVPLTDTLAPPTPVAA